jgi:ATP-binding cassette subfamily B multidrug efflux pump
MSNLHEEEALGKAYDSRLMRRLLQYMKPYKWRVALALVMVAIVTPLELAPPLIFQKAIDNYFVPALKHFIPEASAWTGIGWLSLLFLGVLTFDFLAQYIQIRIMQRVGQQTMYDMRGEIFTHMQRLPMSYFDRNPVGRLVTRVTTDVDALNDLFAAGVVTMINDFFLLVVMAGLLFKIDRRLALDTLAVLPGILIVTMIFRKFVRDANRRIRTAIARINAFLQEYISGMSIVQLFNRERKAMEEFEKRNRDNMLAWRDAETASSTAPSASVFLRPLRCLRSAFFGRFRISAKNLTSCSPPWRLPSVFSNCSMSRCWWNRIPTRSRLIIREAKLNSVTCGSAIATSRSLPRKTGSCAMSRSAWSPGRPSPLWDTRVRARLL